MNIIETFTIVIRTKPGEKLLSRFVVIDTKNNAFVKTKQRNEQLAGELNWDGSAFQTISARFYFTKLMLQGLNMKTNKQKQTNKQNTKTHTKKQWGYKQIILWKLRKPAGMAGKDDKARSTVGRGTHGLREITHKNSLLLNISKQNLTH